MKLKVLDLFSGIGGFSLGLERTGGFETVAFCEIDSFCRQVLAKHWPGVPIHDDIQVLSADWLAETGAWPDVICGGFPCQDISVAGKGAGLGGERCGGFVGGRLRADGPGAVREVHDDGVFDTFPARLDRHPTPRKPRLVGPDNAVRAALLVQGRDDLLGHARRPR